MSATFRSAAVETSSATALDLVEQRHGRRAPRGFDVDDDMAVRIGAVRGAGHRVVEGDRARVAGVGSDGEPAVLAQLDPAEANVDGRRRGDRDAVDLRYGQAGASWLRQRVDGGLLHPRAVENSAARRHRCRSQSRASLVLWRSRCRVDDMRRQNKVAVRLLLRINDDDLAIEQAGDRERLRQAACRCGRLLIGRSVASATLVGAPSRSRRYRSAGCRPCRCRRARCRPRPRSR